MTIGKSIFITFLGMVCMSLSADAQARSKFLPQNQSKCLIWCKKAFLSKSHKPVGHYAKSSDLAIMSSKVYAQLDLSNDAETFYSKYRLLVLLNKYQIVSIDSPIRLRSQSLFIFQPTIGAAATGYANGSLDMEYNAGLHLASNTEAEQRAEHVAGHRWWGTIGWVGKATLKWNFHPFNKRKAKGRID